MMIASMRYWMKKSKRNSDSEGKLKGSLLVQMKKHRLMESMFNPSAYVLLNKMNSLLFAGA